MGLGEAQSWDFRIENAVWMWYSGIAIPVSATQHFYGLLEQSNEYSVRFMPVNGTCKASYRTARWFWANAVDFGNC